MQRFIVIVGFVLALGPANGAGTQAQTTRQESGSSCGPNALTYQVTSHNTASGVGTGIRCVVITGATSGVGGHSIPTIVWYGEGYWGDPRTICANYHHLGVAFTTAHSSNLTGYSSDFPADRPNCYTTFPGELTLHASRGSWRAPSIIDLVAGWDERWTLVQTANYAPPPSPKRCGRYFHRYSVAYLGHTGSGMRCVMRIGKGIKMWFGTGTLGGKSYSQLGFLSSKGFGANDLCGPTFGTRCRAWAPGFVRVREAKQTAHKKGWPQTITATYRGASGSWVEIWHRKS